MAISDALIQNAAEGKSAGKKQSETAEMTSFQYEPQSSFSTEIQRRWIT